VKFTLCVFKQYAMKTYEETHEFLTLALDGSGQLHTLTALPSEAHSTGRRVVTRYWYEYRPYWQSNPHSSTMQLIQATQQDMPLNLNT
jgi:hypothetical protein